jgi:hypothetical protein
MTWNTIFSESLDFQFWKKKSWKSITHKWPFLTVFGHLFANFMNIFHKTEVQTVILRCLVSLNLNWIKSYNIILVKKKFFQCLKMHHFRAVSPKWVLRPQKEISCHIFKMAILTKFFDNLMNHITRKYAGKKFKLFLNVSPLTIVHLLLWPFKVASL